MLKRSAQFIFFIMLSFIWHVSAQAQSYPSQYTTSQSPLPEFSYAQKAQAIQLAKAGDADAFFQLGLSHLYGVNSTQNTKVAERFFFYAAQKGNLEANQYLSLARAENAASRTVMTAEVTVKDQYVQQASYTARETAQAEKRKANAARKKLRAEQKQAQAEKRRAAAQEKKALAKKKRDAAKRKKALANKNKARPQNKSKPETKTTAVETVAVTPAAARVDNSAAPATSGSTDTINPYVRTQPNNNLKLANIPKGLFLMGFLLLSLLIYLFGAYFFKSNRHPAEQNLATISD